MDDKSVLSIEKELEAANRDRPTITYRISTRKDVSFRLRLTERLPESIEGDAVQIPENHTDDWTITGRKAVCERRVQPGHECRTSYRVRIPDEDSLAALGGVPTVEVTSAETDDAAPDWHEVPRSQLDVRGVQREDTPETSRLASDGGDVPNAVDGHSAGSERSNHDGQGATSETSQHRIESAIPAVDDGLGTAPQSPEEETVTGHESAAVGQNGQKFPVDQFLSALEDHPLSEDQRRTLRTALGLDSTTSTNARIEQCQTRLADLAAYIDALEEFLDDSGTGQQLIEEFRSDLEALEDQVATLERGLSTTTTTQDELAERIERLEDDLSGVESLRDDIESVESRLERATGDFTDDLNTLQTAVDDLQNWQELVSDAFGGPSGDDADSPAP